MSSARAGVVRNASVDPGTCLPTGADALRASPV